MYLACTVSKLLLIIVQFSLLTGVSLSLTHWFGVKPGDEVCKIWPQELETSFIVDVAYFDILNHLSVTHVCVGYTNGHTLS